MRIPKVARRGFTIVELLIVIVVIGILAAITIIAYNGIQAKAAVASLQSDLENDNKQLIAYLATSSTGYPTAIDCSASPAANSICLKSSGTTTYQYTVNNTSLSAPSYCLTATTGTTSYFIGGTASNPTPGGCPGHGVGGNNAITNIDPNSSVETGLTGIAGPNLAVITSDTTKSYSGTTSALSTMPLKGASTTGINFYSGNIGNVGSPLALNSTYTVSAWVYVPSATVDMCLSIQGTGLIQQTKVGCTSVKDAWTRISAVITTNPSTAGTFVFYVLNSTATTANMSFYSDAFMVTSGSTLYNYADPNVNSSWVWNGTANASTATGPQI